MLPECVGRSRMPSVPAAIAKKEISSILPGTDLIGNETAADVAKQREPSLDRSQCRGERDRSSQDTCRIRCEVVEGKRENIIAEGNETDDPYCRQFEHFSDAPEGNSFAFFYLIILDRQE